MQLRATSNGVPAEMTANERPADTSITRLAGSWIAAEPSFSLDDAFLASLGGTCAVSSAVRCGAFHDFREASYPGNDDMHEASVFAAIRFSDARRLPGYLLAGFTDSSPEWGIGMTVTRRF
jgi:hypothetical protein